MKLNKILFLTTFIFFNTLLTAEENYLNIDASHFEANQQKGILHFQGNVKMIKNKDILKAQDLLINTKPSKKDPNKQIPKDYKATGDVSFIIHTEDNTLKGTGETVFYYPDEQKYIIVGNGYLEDTKEGKKLTADTIYIDEKTGHTRIDGNEDKPVKFRLKLNEE